MSSSFYRSNAWRVLRAACLRRDPWCTTAGCRERSTVADHRIERAKGGPDTLSNLRGLCPHHHNMRRRGGEPYLKGAAADGTPADPRHWWNAP